MAQAAWRSLVSSSPQRRRQRVREPRRGGRGPNGTNGRPGKPDTHTLISRGCSCRHAIVLKGHEKINLQCKCHIIETEHEANSGKPRKHIRSRKDGRYAGMANSGIPSCCLALLDQVSSKTPGPPAMWNFRPCSRTLHTHGAPTGATSLVQGPLSLASINCARKSCGDD